MNKKHTLKLINIENFIYTGTLYFLLDDSLLMLHYNTNNDKTSINLSYFTLHDYPFNLQANKDIINTYSENFELKLSEKEFDFIKVFSSKETYDIADFCVENDILNPFHEYISSLYLLSGSLINGQLHYKDSPKIKNESPEFKACSTWENKDSITDIYGLYNILVPSLEIISRQIKS